MSASTIKCPSGHSNSPAQKFCGECGIPLAGICPDGHQNAEGQRYCGECGASLQDSESTAALADDATPDTDRATVPPEAADVRQAEGVPRVGATFVTATGEDATVREVTGDDVWVDIQRDGNHIGTFRFSTSAVKAVLTQQHGDPSRQPPPDTRGFLPPPTPPASKQAAWAPPSAESHPPVMATVGAAYGRFAAAVGPWWAGLSSKGKIAVTAVPVAAILLLSLVLGGGGSNGGGGGGRPSYSTVDDWVASVCKVGTYSNHGGGLNNADASGFCMSPNNMPIMIGQYSSSFSAQSDAAMVPGARYAMLPQADGRTCLFLAVSAGSGDILRPLSRFGATFGTS